MSFIRVASTCIAAGVVCGCHRQMPMDEHMSHMAAGDMAAPAAVANGGQGIAGLPPSNNAAAARLAASPRHAEWVKLAWSPGSKDSLMAWIVYPSTSRAKTPVVVVVHEIFGLSTWVRSVADQVAAEGFIAIAPDLFSRMRGGPSADELPGDSARKLSNVPPADRNAGITAVARYAMSQPSAAPKYAVIGYCWGGTTVWIHSINQGTTGFSGGVAFYGSFPNMNGAVPVADSIAKIKTPVMLLSGSKDARIGASMPAIDSAMKASGKWYFGKNYEGAIHGFLRAQDDTLAKRNPAEEQANLDATKDAWPRTVAFLKTNLGLNK